MPTYKVVEGRHYCVINGVEQYFVTGEIFTTNDDLTALNHQGAGTPKFVTTGAASTGQGHGPKTPHKQA